MQSGMNRRDFWSVITGGLVGARLGWFKDPSRWWTAVDMAGPTVVKIPINAIDAESFRKMVGPLIERFRHLTLEMNHTTDAVTSLRKDIMSSPVFLDLEEDDD